MKTVKWEDVTLAVERGDAWQLCRTDGAWVSFSTGMWSRPEEVSALLDRHLPPHVRVRAPAAIGEETVPSPPETRLVESRPGAASPPTPKIGWKAWAAALGVVAVIVLLVYVTMTIPVLQRALPYLLALGILTALLSAMSDDDV